MPFKNRKNHSKGFTILELIITLAIMMALAAIAIPLFTQYKQKGYDAELAADAKNSYTASQSWLSDNPDSTVDSLQKLLTSGYRPSRNITWGSGSMTSGSGSIVLVSSSADNTKNVATIFYNGNINIAP